MCASYKHGVLTASRIDSKVVNSGQVGISRENDREMKIILLLIAILAAGVLVPTVTTMEQVEAVISQSQSSEQNLPIITTVISQSQSSSQDSGW